jgi:hypothetical protein
MPFVHEHVRYPGSRCGAYSARRHAHRHIIADPSAARPLLEYEQLVDLHTRRPCQRRRLRAI